MTGNLTETIVLLVCIWLMSTVGAIKSPADFLDKISTDMAAAISAHREAQGNDKQPRL